MLTLKQLEPGTASAAILGLVGPDLALETSEAPIVAPGASQAPSATILEQAAGELMEVASG